MANVNVKVTGLDEIKAKLGDIPKNIFSEETLTELGLFFVSKIKMRTAEGKDADGNFFKPYSAKYSVFREKYGADTNTVDLFLTGSMMGAMQAEALPSQKAVRLYFLNTTDRSGTLNPVKAAGLNKDRRFFALSADEIDQGLEIIKRRAMQL